ncbi:peptidase family S51 [Bacteriovorax sp. BAL6_X]|uniref:Type 1 glutamine amidotransferase-like domain-containing protein n=1 Tax=Bacteriovorax sp. BAL6_X TaxID=1201290 RepID=UPI0003862D7F|nr:Type 1 glutamine amidotransferase-like domain-containing protein [Bacteriovorax sp. BAL6_X]EPZ51840.1 peptidase family S51 [Bacteriovorax sp. BAL6_X]
MKIGLYGGGDFSDNVEIDEHILELCNSDSPSITYIPAGSYESELEFIDLIMAYKKIGFKRFIHFPVDHEFDRTLKEEALQSDVIHLGGGNTFYFLKHLKESGMFEELIDYVGRGGVLTGLSAGAIITTPNILTASFPPWDRDDNEDNVTDFEAMNIVDFEFFPHYRKSKRYDDELKRHSILSLYPIYACPDGSGLVVTDEEIVVHGECYIFENGQKFKL